MEAALLRDIATLWVKLHEKGALRQQEACPVPGQTLCHFWAAGFWHQCSAPSVSDRPCVPYVQAALPPSYKLSSGTFLAWR